jgi:hypothetical protein
MTAYPMGTGDDEDLRRSENEGYGHETSVPGQDHRVEDSEGYQTGGEDRWPQNEGETAEPTTEASRDDDLVVASGEHTADERTTDERLADEDETVDGERFESETVDGERVETTDAPVENFGATDEPVEDFNATDEPTEDFGAADEPVVPAEPVEPVAVATPDNTPDDLPRSTADAERPLFEGDFSDGLQQRWHDVQAGFVDDPYETVQQAEQLAQEVVAQLTTALEERKNAIDERWSNEKDNTEELRQSLKGYRTLVDRLLSL